VSRAEDAARRQREALAPDASVWVAASAGTGKTRVLTDRLLRLMLEGTDPARILCLTFTRAAAAEMANRVNASLAEWATLPDGRLAQGLQQLTARMPDAHDMAQARRLFARVLDTPGGAKIATIHAFCQSLLRRFPLEAGVPPEFAVIEERSAAEALQDAAARVIAAARAGTAPGCAEALAIVAHYAQEERFAELIATLVAERGKLRAALKDGEGALHARLSRSLGISTNATVDGLSTEFCLHGACDEVALTAAAEALCNGSKSDCDRGTTLARWCAHPEGRFALIEEYVGVYLTDKNEIRKNLITVGAAANAATVPAVLAAEADRVKAFVEARAGAALREATCALVRLGAAVLEDYERHKRLHGQLDYDDLVAKALDLLRRPGVAPWVLFKLDGGLDHILIDEAQDTNPEQWAIVAALAGEFFAGDGARERSRTVFAVGDAKQSIFSFQRADPQEFVRMRAHFQRRVDAARMDWRVVPLEISFRATEPLLRAVDAVFSNADAADGVALDGSAIHHVAAREGHAGLVELWPPVPAAADPAPEPLAAVAAGAPEAKTRLAKAIAAKIDTWLKSGERLKARGRAMTPGDILVLVRRRNDFMFDLLRALKAKQIPVAGADRLILTEQLAVKDLVALGQFLLLPEDDLTLATVLKGPLFDISEEELFLLAYGRDRETLWRRLRRCADEDLGMRQVYERLSALLNRADFVPPFELYAQILGDPRAGRGAMLERLGPEAADPIEEFLALALAYEREHVPSLQGFLHWLITGEVEVKRDFGERQRDELLIMTVHGAKGLEAPVVFLPDTLQTPDWPKSPLWSDGEPLPLWCPRGNLRGPFYDAQRNACRQRDLQEYRRLLYVALTRAQDRLYVCGWNTRTMAKAARYWHTLCQTGWRELATSFEFDSRQLIGDRDGWHGEGLRIEGAQHVAPEYKQPLAAERVAPALPVWATAPPPAEPDPPKPLLPSRPAGEEPAPLSPLGGPGRDRFRRGLIVHRLLQALPDLAPTEREAAARRYLALPLHGLAAAEQDEIRAEALAVLDEPGFAELWGPNAQSEVPVVGLIDGQALSGQIDRIVVADDRVLIVDYKTLRPPPETEEGVPTLYLRQLATYRAALSRIYPGRRIDCALLWTEGPRLMPISPARLAQQAAGSAP
jgi:ATP-dependent helicase/nuclease subunit A